MQALLPRTIQTCFTFVRFAVSHRRFPIAAAAMAVLLSLPALSLGLRPTTAQACGLQASSMPLASSAHRDLLVSRSLAAHDERSGQPILQRVGWPHHRPDRAAKHREQGHGVKRAKQLFARRQADAPERDPDQQRQQNG